MDVCHGPFTPSSAAPLRQLIMIMLTKLPIGLLPLFLRHGRLADASIRPADRLADYDCGDAQS